MGGFMEEKLIVTSTDQQVGGGDKVLISKFSILTTGELFIGYIQTMFGF